MKHLEFYVLWSNGTWSVEGVNNVRRQAHAEETIRVGREALAMQIAHRDKDAIVGPLYVMCNQRQTAKS